MRMNDNAKAGFSLFELMLVIILMGILIGGGAFGLNAYVDWSDKEGAKSKARAVDAALVAYDSTIPSASGNYTAAVDDDARWLLIRDYASASSVSFSDFGPDGGYSLVLPNSLSGNVQLLDSSGDSVPVY